MNKRSRAALDRCAVHFQFNYTITIRLLHFPIQRQRLLLRRYSNTVLLDHKLPHKVPEEGGWQRGERPDRNLTDFLREGIFKLLFLVFVNEFKGGKKNLFTEPLTFCLSSALVVLVVVVDSSRDAAFDFS